MPQATNSTPRVQTRSSLRRPSPPSAGLTPSSQRSRASGGTVSNANVQIILARLLIAGVVIAFLKPTTCAPQVVGSTIRGVQPTAGRARRQRQRPGVPANAASANASGQPSGPRSSSRPAKTERAAPPPNAPSAMAVSRPLPSPGQPAHRPSGVLAGSQEISARYESRVVVRRGRNVQTASSIPCSMRLQMSAATAGTSDGARTACQRCQTARCSRVESVVRVPVRPGGHAALSKAGGSRSRRSGGRRSSA